MSLLELFRPPRYVATLSILVTLAAVSAMAWLGWELLRRERALDAQRTQETLENSADRAVSALQRETAALEKLLPPAPDSAIPEDVVVFAADGHNLRVRPAGGIIYYPDAGEEREAGDTFRSGEVLEFGSDPSAAILVYKSLAASADSAIRTGALLRLGRTLRKANRPAEALQAYSSLVAQGGVRIDGLPAALVGREARCTVLEKLGGKESLLQEAQDLCRELELGRWQIPRGAWLFLRQEAQSWLPVPARCAPVSAAKLAASATAEALWKRWHSLSATGHELSFTGSQPVLSVWAASPKHLSIVLAGESFLNAMCRRVGRATGVKIALTGERERPIVSSFVGAIRAQATRAGILTNLPWNVNVGALDGVTLPVELQGRQRILLAGFALASLLVLAGGYFMVRGIHRELAVAKLQSDFVAAVSHEFRTPLTSLRQLSEMLAGGRLIHEDRRQRYYEAMVDETGRLQRLVEELLNFGRMEAGVVRYRFDPMDASDMVRGVVKGFQRQLESGSLQLKLPEAPCPIRGDREALSLAVWNLLDNAFKYSPRGSSVQVEVSRNATLTAIAVSDNGPGIPPEDRKRIFKKFVRGASAVSSGAQGTGIGLSIVQHVIQGQQGQVRLDSEHGRGSTFTLLLPVGEQS
jgi:signal transduction histidine kinase